MTVDVFSRMLSYMQYLQKDNIEVFCSHPKEELNPSFNTVDRMDGNYKKETNRNWKQEMMMMMMMKIDISNAVAWGAGYG